MNTHPLRHRAVAYAKFSTVGLLLAVTVGCGASQSEPSADVSVAPTATTDTSADASDATATDAKAASNDPPAAPAQAAPPQGEPGYVGYPLMGETAADRKSTRLNSSHSQQSRMPSSA